MLAATGVSGQTTTPSGPITTPVANGPSVSPATQADQMIARIRGAMTEKDYHTAVQGFRTASQQSGYSPVQVAELQKLRKQLEQIGIDPALLALPMPAMTAEAKKKEALRLTAIGRAALDRGEVKTALTAARQAEALKVPESAYVAGEPRVWQLLLDAESAARRNGIALENPGGTADVQTVGGTQAATGQDQGAVAQMLFKPDTQANQPAVAQVQAVTAVPGEGQGFAAQAYQQGLKALAAGDTDAARALFKEAWANQDQLDPATRTQLKDKLTLLQPKRIPENTAIDPSLMTPIQRAELEAQDRARRLFREVTAELANTEQQKVAALDALDDLESLRRRVDGADVDEQSKRSIAVMVDRAIADQKKYIDANRAKIDLDLQNEAVRLEMATEQARVKHR